MLVQEVVVRVQMIFRAWMVSIKLKKERNIMCVYNIFMCSWFAVTILPNKRRWYSHRKYTRQITSDKKAGDLVFFCRHFASKYSYIVKFVSLCHLCAFWYNIVVIKCANGQTLLFIRTLNYDQGYDNAIDIYYYDSNIKQKQYIRIRLYVYVDVKRCF